MCIGLCDKCGRPVLPDHDARRVDEVILGTVGVIMAAMAEPRHLLPVVVNGIEICEGSPTRMQYLALLGNMGLHPVS